MRQIITLIIILVSINYGNIYGQVKKFKNQSVKAQDIELSHKPKQTICFGSGIVGTNHVPPSRKYYDGLVNGRTEAGSDIVVTYVTAISPEARNAFEFAVGIWERILVSQVPIRIQANWQPISGSGRGQVLGSAAPADARISALMPKFPAWYPMALYEKILGRNANANGFEIVARFNSDANWYFGIDGRTPKDKIDFVSVVLHELGHGLGFFGGYTVNQDGTGEVGLSGYPFIYDTYVANESGLFLADTLRFKNPSTALASQFIAKGIYFDAPYVTSRNGKARTKLYSPTTFAPTSSIAHLDQTTYQGTQNSLMTPFTNNGESIQDPGGIVINMFEEMGWILTQIKHIPIKNTDQVAQPLTITANIISDTLIDLKKFKISLYYSDDNFKTQKLVEVQVDKNGQYIGQIPAPNANKTISYYFVTQDPNGREIRFPYSAPTIPFRVTVSVDNDPPTIAHTSEGFLLDNTDTAFIVAKVTDLLGVDTVFAEYQIDNGTVATIPMIFLGNDNFGGGVYGNILITRGLLRLGGTFKYRITSRDISSKKNQGSMPSASDFYTLNIVKIGDAKSAYENNFNQASNDFVSNAFKIEQVSGFADAALHSEHPYKDGKGANDESDFIALLTTPIIIRDKDATVKFDEIVLVEPGEAGSVFGDGNFWDYVTVEGSADKGKTWNPIINGYDSRDNSVWLSAFNRSVVNNSSATVGTPSLFRPRSINLLDRFKPNDQVLLRFRLYGDQSTHGWGWAIDNLQIQSTVVGLADYLVYQGDIKVFPNPSQGIFNLTLSNTKLGDVNIRLYNVLGSEVKNFQFVKIDQTFQTELNVGNLTKGIYFLYIRTKEGSAIRKISID
jgi:Secretion system C-terminal sorting domain